MTHVSSGKHGLTPDMIFRVLEVYFSQSELCGDEGKHTSMASDLVKFMMAAFPEQYAAKMQ